MLKRSAGVLLALLIAGSAFGDDLAALARKERERRAKLAKPAKVYTEGDGKSGSVTTLEPSPAPAAAAANPAPSPDAQRPIWKARAEAARTEIFNAQSALDIMEREYSEYQSDIAEVPANEIQDPMRLQKREAHLQELKAGLENQRRIVSDAKKSLTAVEDAARAAGIPPGWLR